MKETLRELTSGCLSSATVLHGCGGIISSSSPPTDVRGTASTLGGNTACFQQARSLTQSRNLDVAHVWQRVSQEDFLALLAAICPGG